MSGLYGSVPLCRFDDEARQFAAKLAELHGKASALRQVNHSDGGPYVTEMLWSFSA